MTNLINGQRLQRLWSTKLLTKECSYMDNKIIAHEWFRYAVQDLLTVAV